jgi:exodeoxyribonuclease VII small subunit
VTETKKQKTQYMEKKETYNEAVEKLRAIVEDIENGELDVDLLSEKVKEATRLIKLCKEKLFKADEEVKKILEEMDS